MKEGKLINGWWLVALLLVVVIAAGGVAVGSKYHRGDIEISIAPGRPLSGNIYVGGEVNNPGLYPLVAGDSLDDIIRAAGGISDNADMSRLGLRIPALNAPETAQKVNLHLAAAWLLMALPDIGQDRAQAIIEYRRLNGPFRSTGELLRVEGIGAATYEKIKDLITVTD